MLYEATGVFIDHRNLDIHCRLLSALRKQRLKSSTGFTSVAALAGALLQDHDEPKIEILKVDNSCNTDYSMLPGPKFRQNLSAIVADLQCELCGIDIFEGNSSTTWSVVAMVVASLLKFLGGIAQSRPHRRPTLRKIALLPFPFPLSRRARMTLLPSSLALSWRLGMFFLRQRARRTLRMPVQTRDVALRIRTHPLSGKMSWMSYPIITLPSEPAIVYSTAPFRPDCHACRLAKATVKRHIKRVLARDVGKWGG